MLIPVMTVAENIVSRPEPTHDGVRSTTARRASAWRALASVTGSTSTPTRASRHHGRPAAARRDPQGALPRRRDPDPRRADRRAHAAGGAGALRDHARAEGAGEVDHLHHPQAERGARDRRPHHGAAARQDDRRRARPSGATEESLARHDGRPRGAAARREAGRRTRATRCSRSRTSRRSTTAGSRRSAACRSSARRRDRRHRRRRRQRPDRADRRDRRPAPSRRAGTSVVDGEDVTDANARETLDAGVGHIPEDRSAAGSCSSSRSPRTSRCTTTASRRTRGSAGSVPARLSSVRARLIKEFDVRGGGAADAGRRALGRQPAEARPRPRDRARPGLLIAAQPTRGLDVGAIEFLHRRLVDRARRGPRRPARLARARRDPLALRPDPRDLRGPDRRRVHADASEEELGLAMLGGGARGGRCVTDADQAAGARAAGGGRARRDAAPREPRVALSGAPGGSWCRSRRRSSPS